MQHTSKSCAGWCTAVVHQVEVLSTRMHYILTKYKNKKNMLPRLVLVRRVVCVIRLPTPLFWTSILLYVFGKCDSARINMTYYFNVHFN